MIKSQSDMALYRRSASFSKKVLLFQKISLLIENYNMKSILSDAESRKEHDATKFSPIG